MKRLKLKKKVKGMTLVEIIIALFVFTVAALLMVQIGEAATRILRHSTHVNRKTAVEAPYVANEVMDKDADGNDVNPNVVDKGTVQVKINTGAQDASGAYVPIVIDGTKYSSEGAVDPADPLTSGVDYDLSFVYIDIASYGFSGIS